MSARVLIIDDDEEYAAALGRHLTRAGHEVLRLFEDDDPRAGKLFDEQAELLRNAFNDEYGPLAAAVHGFDFELAQALLHQSAERETESHRSEGSPSCPEHRRRTARADQD